MGIINSPINNSYKLARLPILLGIGTFKIFTIWYNINIFLTIQYLNNILTIQPASQGPNIVKFSTVSFVNFANKLQTAFIGDVQVANKSIL